MSKSAVSWVPPSSGHYKLNVDVADLDEDRNYGLAAVVRDSNGVVVSTSCWYHLLVTDSDAPEGPAENAWLT